MNKSKNVKVPSDDEFWALVTLANEDFDAFTKTLERMDRGALIAFAWKFEQLAGILYDDEYLQHLNFENELSEDYLEDLCGWIVGKGKVFYEDIINHPEKMPTELDDTEPGISIQFEASQIYFDRYGEEMPPWEEIID